VAAAASAPAAGAPAARGAVHLEEALALELHDVAAREAAHGGLAERVGGPLCARVDARGKVLALVELGLGDEVVKVQEAQGAGQPSWQEAQHSQRRQRACSCRKAFFEFL
jgi:hypothetical protein